MTGLELQQRGLLALLKGRSSPDDPYLQRVAGSRELAMVREIAIWWRAFQIEVQCRFTSRLLKRLGSFSPLVTAYFDNHATSSFAEELGPGFLETLRMDGDPLIRLVSQFEYGFLRARSGSNESFETLWDRHPDLVFLALENGSELPGPEPGCLYRMHVARTLPHLVACNREYISVETCFSTPVEQRSSAESER
jgi:hypothetical protein